jgi:flagellar assembly protein FliH
MNATAEEKLKIYIELKKLKETPQKTCDSDLSQDFVPGLFAATVEQIPEKEEDIIKNQFLMQEALLMEQQRSEEAVTLKAKEIIDDAKEEVKRILKGAKAEATACSEQIRQDAFQSGYHDGYNKAIKEINSLKEDLEVEKLQLEKEYENKVKEFEPTFVDLFIAYIKRFTGVILDDKKDIILYLLEQVLLNIENSNVYLIHVSKEDYEMVYSKKHEIAWKVNENAEIEIIEDRMLTRAQCLIETDSRVIDCSLDVQLKNLVHDLKLLAGPKLNEMT